MKVGLVVFRTALSPTTGGAYSFLAEVMRSVEGLLGGGGHEWIALCDGGAEEDVGHLCSIPTAPFRSRWLPVRLAQALPRYMRGALRHYPGKTSLEAKARKIGVEFLWYATPGMLQTDLPYMTVVWDLQHRKQPWFPEVSSQGQWASREFAYDTFLRRATRIIVGTKAGRDEVRTYYGIDTDRFVVLPHPTPAFALAPPVVDETAVLRRFKNHVNLLCALAQVDRSTRLQPRLVLVGGDKGNREHVEATIASLGLTAKVRVLGFVQLEELVALYRCAGALVYPSFFGPENLPPLEAFALGCPVVAAKVDGAEEQLADAALLVDPKSPTAIAEGIGRILSDGELRQTLVARGRERSRSYTGDDFVRGAAEAISEFAMVRRVWR
jgi:glycosyltransferase involved in cell wall biosynthesis